ncbi:hypothetical protein PPQ74_002524 [Salmonella enterica]|nr:hypothetical protein [Salmonella enterica]
MKLSVGDIRFSESGCASTNVGVEPRELPFPICTMHVSVPLVEGKALEQYKEELLEKARERIARMYEEIIYGGDTDGEAIKPFKVEDLKIKPSELSRELIERIQNTSPTHNLEMRVALLEKRLSGKRSVHAGERVVDFYNPDGSLGVRIGDLNQQEKYPENAGALSGIYAIGKKAAEDYISGREEHPDGRVELSVNRITSRSDSPYVIVSLSCVDKLNCEILSLNIEVERDDRKGIPYYESVAINKAGHIIKRISAQL